MKSFFEFYQVLKCKQLLEQDMGQAPQVGAAAPDFSATQMGAGMPPAPASATPQMQAGGMPPAPVPQGANPNMAPAPATAGNEESNVAPSEGELDTETLDQALETIRNMIPNLETKLQQMAGAQGQEDTAQPSLDDVLNQLSQLINNALGRSETPPEPAEDAGGADAGMGMPGGIQGMQGQMSADQQADMGGMGGDMGAAAPAAPAAPAGSPM